MHKYIVGWLFFILGWKSAHGHLESEMISGADDAHCPSNSISDQLYAVKGADVSTNKK